MKTVRDHIESIPDLNVRAALYRNISSSSLDCGSAFIELTIGSCFTWSKSIEGVGYWRKIQKKLQR